jgi:hypothetical protein
VKQEGRRISPIDLPFDFRPLAAKLVQQPCGMPSVSGERSCT